MSESNGYRFSVIKASAPDCGDHGRGELFVFAGKALVIQKGGSEQVVPLMRSKRMRGETVRGSEFALRVHRCAGPFLSINEKSDTLTTTCGARYLKSEIFSGRSVAEDLPIEEIETVLNEAMTEELARECAKFQKFEGWTTDAISSSYYVLRATPAALGSGWVSFTVGQMKDERRAPALLGSFRYHPLRDEIVFVRKLDGARHGYITVSLDNLKSRLADNGRGRGESLLSPKGIEGMRFLITKWALCSA